MCQLQVAPAQLLCPKCADLHSSNEHVCALQAFLTAVMQTYARHNKLPLDVMKFRTDVTTKSVEQITEAAPVGCYIHGNTCATLCQICAWS